MHLVKKRRQAAARLMRSLGSVRAHAMMMAASSGVAVRRLVASRVARRVAAGIRSVYLHAAGFASAAHPSLHACAVFAPACCVK